ncbi:hypothetical protein NBT05_05105 [Aquimarina sp. ERC-38]|uniref:hypothetical protein n=1 Tax=Aquimarina sp. ERC-38 TaxID=2949996 RepID=UPI0022450D9B|nr:hypothetical protein [Aquimarina sp. ERC-38]UZO81844.1 hypothetical protein NBT05_05105 [Aquimarina sp. ERC-38]
MVFNACETEPINETGNYETKSSTDFVRTYTDGSGQIEIIYIEKRYNSEDEGDPADFKKTTLVPDGYICIGGSVSIPGIGAFIYESYPSSGRNDAYKGWTIAAKYHGNNSPKIGFPVTISVIGLRLKDNDGKYIPESKLKEYMLIKRGYSSFAKFNRTSATLPNDYELIGGGANLDFLGFGEVSKNGALLKESYPSGNTWIASGGSYIFPAASKLSAFAIGIKKEIPNFGNIEKYVLNDFTGSCVNNSCSDTEAFPLVGPGGTFLGTCPGFKINPASEGWYANRLFTRTENNSRLDAQSLPINTTSRGSMDASLIVVRRRNQ